MEQTQIIVPSHLFCLSVAARHLVSPVQVMSSVHLALEARLFVDRVLRAVLWGDDPEHWS